MIGTHEPKQATGTNNEKKNEPRNERREITHQPGYIYIYIPGIFRAVKGSAGFGAPGVNEAAREGDRRTQDGRVTYCIIPGKRECSDHIHSQMWRVSTKEHLGHGSIVGSDRYEVPGNLLLPLWVSFVNITIVYT